MAVWKGKGMQRKYLEDLLLHWVKGEESVGWR